MVHIQYCQGCQYNKTFNDVKSELEMMGIAAVTFFLFKKKGHWFEFPLEPTTKFIELGCFYLPMGFGYFDDAR